MATINAQVTMQNGTGMGLFIKVDTNVLHFSGSGAQPMNLAPGDYIATVGGNEPSSANVTVQFLKDGAELAKQSFSTPTFFGFVPFTVS